MVSLVAWGSKCPGGSSWSGGELLLAGHGAGIRAGHAAPPGALSFRAGKGAQSRGKERAEPEASRRSRRHVPNPEHAVMCCRNRIDAATAPGDSAILNTFRHTRV